MEVLNADLAGGASSEEVTVTPLSALGFNSDRPCLVLAKNTVEGDATWAVLYRCSRRDDTRIIYPTSGVIKVVAGPAGARVLICDAEV